MFDFTAAINERETEVIAQFKRAINYLVHGRGKLDGPNSWANFSGPDSQATITLLHDGTVTVTQDQDEAQGMFVMGIAYCEEPMQCGNDIRSFPVNEQYSIELSLPTYLPESTTTAIIEEMERAT